MTSTTQQPVLSVYRVEQQGTGAFDGGKITETKPIGFPGEKSAVSRVGPLFYWAWATSHDDAVIGLHPHKGFEIISYVLAGELGHYDTLGTRSRVAAGGAQLMQTGSGVAHEERVFGDGSEFFQIWFEPHLAKAVTRAPTYREIAADEFPVAVRDGVRLKSVLGPGAPAQLVADAQATDVTIEPGRQHGVTLMAGRSIAAVVIDGNGGVDVADPVASEEQESVATRDFVVVRAERETVVTFSADASRQLRLFVVEVPSRVDYPLYSS
ncbi:MAG: pirin family protein [Planctomycetales bacterium]|nr:pirin family protein [Planctomycetales bacterium]